MTKFVVTYNLVTIEEVVHKVNKSAEYVKIVEADNSKDAEQTIQKEIDQLQVYDKVRAGHVVNVASVVEPVFK